MIEYNCIKFNGAMLNPSFSIYLFEIKKGYDKYFYIGMTGDNHYPSARSIMHRLAGHIDLLTHSTQNQFLKAIKGLFNKSTNDDLTIDELSQLQITLHHWPIDGFKKWVGDKKAIDKTTSQYKEYSAMRSKVAELEAKLIFDFNSKYLLNRTKGKRHENMEEYYLIIYNKIKEIMRWVN